MGDSVPVGEGWYWLWGDVWAKRTVDGGMVASPNGTTRWRVRFTGESEIQTAQEGPAFFSGEGKNG